MSIPHPFEFIPTGLRRTFFILFLALTLVIVLIFQFVIDPPLRTALSPLGIVSFELAWSVDAVRAIMGAWDYTTSLYAAFGLGFDFLFMLCYVFTIGMATLMGSKRMGPRFMSVGKWLGWGVILAAILDMLENIFLFIIMTRGNYPPYAALAGVAASFKFLLIIISIVFALLSLLIPKTARTRKAKKTIEPDIPPPTYE